MIWTTVAIGVLLTFVVTAFLIVRADDAQKEVEAFITKHGFRASVPGDSLSQLVIDYPNSIHYYSIAEATKDQEDDAIESLEQMFKGWDKRDIDRFGAVYVNDDAAQDVRVYTGFHLNIFLGIGLKAGFDFFRLVRAEFRRGGDVCAGPV